MSLSLKEIYDVLITEIGVIAIPRNNQYKINSLIRVSYDNIRNTSGTNIGAYQKANALFKCDYYLKSGPAVKDLVEHGIVKANGGAQDAALFMLSSLTMGKLQDEVEYIENLLNSSITYRVALNENIQNIDRNSKTLTNQDYKIIESLIHSKYEKQFSEIKTSITDNIRIKLQNMLADYVDEFSLEPKQLRLQELCTVCISICVSVFDICVKRSKQEIKEKQEEIKAYIKELNAKDDKKSTIEQLLACAYYNTYGMLSEVKDRNNSRKVIRKIYGKFEDVYQLPEIVSAYSYSKDEGWNLSDLNNRRHVVWAPNGCGKTTFLKGILFSSSYAYRESNNERETDKMEALLKYHGLSSNDYFPVFIEASYYADVMAKKNDSWVYEIVERQTGFDKTKITIEDFQLVLKKNNASKKLLYLIDGYDELNYEYKGDFMFVINQLINSEYGSNAIAIITSRPSFDTTNFNGFNYWSIQQISFEKNKEFVKGFIESYCRCSPYFSSEKIFNMISENHYLSEMITTPEILIDVIIGCAKYLNDENGKNSDICDIVDETIDDLIQRIDAVRSIKVNEYGGLSDFKTVYEVLAYDYFCGKPGVKDGNFTKALEDTIEKLGEENERNYRKLRNLIDDKDKIAELFFTWMSVVKSDGTYISFLSETFAEHLAAKRFITLISKESDSDRHMVMFQNLGEAKYRVFVILCTLSYYLKDIDLQDNVLPKIGALFSSIIKKTMSEKTLQKNEMIPVRNMIIDIISKRYGENIICNRLIPEVLMNHKKEITELVCNPCADEGERGMYAKLLSDLWE